MAAQAPRKLLLPVRPDERILPAPTVARFARQAWFSVTLAAILSLHVALLAILFLREPDGPPPRATGEDTPVEVVLQLPEPPPPAPHPAAPQQVQERPATSAPRAPNEEVLDAADAEGHAPKVAASPEEAAPPPQPATSRSDDTKPDDAKPAEADDIKPPDPAKEAEALDQAPPEPPRRPAKLAMTKPVPAKAPGKPSRTAVQQLAGASELPDYTFAKPMRKHAKVTGGTEDDRYLAVIYALVTRNQEAIPLPGGIWTVSVSFQVDGAGNLIGIDLSQSSGHREIDAAALEAVQQAAPFPPPPSGGVTGLVSRLRSAESETSLRRGR